MHFKRHLLVFSFLFSVPNLDAFLTPALQPLRTNHLPSSLSRQPNVVTPIRASSSDWRDQGSLDRKTFHHEPPRHLKWVLLGISYIYLAHFSSMYTQLPGLFGQTGLLPISDRITTLQNDLLALSFFPTPELGLECCCALGILVSASQIVFRQLRQGWPGVATFAVQWIFWHDLVVAGGRFTSYQMDLLLLDVAPLTLLAASGVSPIAATFGFQWLLARLYLGAGAVKLLSCDESWRDLSAIHWHFQSQPLPNPIGAWAYLHVPQELCKALVLFVLIWEMAAPYVFLAPSLLIRRVSFLLNLFLMVGIATFGNFGPLQVLIVVISFSLLGENEDESAAAPIMAPTETQVEQNNLVGIHGSQTLPLLVVSAVTLGLFCGATFWVINTMGAECVNTLSIAPLVYDLILLGVAVAFLPILQSVSDGLITTIVCLSIVLGSAPVLANGLGIELPLNDAFNFLSFGAIPYGLFATMTGEDGTRLVAAIEAAQSAEGPWHYIPFWYQVNDPSRHLSFLFPHFPRLDWTIWFLPLGESGSWIARFAYGLLNRDPAVIGLLNKAEFDQQFPNGPPAIVRIVPRKYELTTGRNTWVSSDSLISPTETKITRGDVEFVAKRGTSSWSSVPMTRALAERGRPECFIWGCLGSTWMTEIVMNSKKSGQWDEESEC